MSCAKLRKALALPLAVATIMLSGCGSSDFAKAEKAINSGLAAHPSCQPVPVEVELPGKPGGGELIEVLKAAGLVTDGLVKEATSWGKPKDLEGYVFTEKGKQFIAQPSQQGAMQKQPCIRSGRFEVVKIEAIDFGTSIEGKPIANVRATIRFVPEEWLASTRTKPQWANYWASIQDRERANWMYRLIKSGDQFFYTESGERLK